MIHEQQQWLSAFSFIFKYRIVGNHPIGRRIQNYQSMHTAIVEIATLLFDGFLCNILSICKHILGLVDFGTEFHYKFEMILFIDEVYF